MGKVVIKDGRVMAYERHVVWNGEPSVIMDIARNGAGFKIIAGDPEHGGGSRVGTINEILAGYHKDVAGPIERLFALENATPETVRGLGFEGYEFA